MMPRSLTVVPGWVFYGAFFCLFRKRPCNCWNLYLYGQWNSYIWPLIVTNSEEMRDLRGYFHVQRPICHPVDPDDGGFHHATLPLLIVFLFAQRFFIERYYLNWLKGLTSEENDW